MIPDEDNDDDNTNEFEPKLDDAETGESVRLLYMKIHTILACI